MAARICVSKTYFTVCFARSYLRSELNGHGRVFPGNVYLQPLSIAGHCARQAQLRPVAVMELYTRPRTRDHSRPPGTRLATANIPVCAPGLPTAIVDELSQQLQRRLRAKGVFARHVQIIDEAY